METRHPYPLVAVEVAVAVAVEVAVTASTSPFSSKWSSLAGKGLLTLTLAPLTPLRRQHEMHLEGGSRRCFTDFD